MLIAVIPFRNRDDVIQTILKYQDRVDGFEIRWDYASIIQIQDINALRKASPRKLIYTLRRSDQGGYYQKSEAERFKDLVTLCQGKPDYLDLEWDVPNSWIEHIRKDYPNVKLIGSYHHFKSTPDVAPNFFDDCFDVIKVATFCNSSLDALRLLNWQKQMTRPSIFLGMGELSSFSRPLGPIFGRYFDYAAISNNDILIPGQLTVDEMLKTYRYRNINLKTRIYALIGAPINASIGHQFHNRIFGEQDLNAVYVKLLIKPEELLCFFQLISEFPFDGLSVTMPLKKLVNSFVEDKMPQVGALNTLKYEDGRWIGINTDGEGAIRALGQRFSKVFILGAGGAACALSYAFIERGTEVSVWNRRSYSNLGFPVVDEFPRNHDYDLLINTLPDEVYKNHEFLEKVAHWLKPGMSVMDINYQNSTVFLDKIVHLPVFIVPGLKMFIEQALLQQAFWFGKVK